jgi:pimeloyl-ACP methyl ester carboxylesterase
VIVDGIKLEIASFGSGERLPIVLLHEGLGSVGLWRDFPNKLAGTTGRRVIAWSRRGYGQSSPFTEPYDLDFMHREADATDRILAVLGIVRAHLLGHSDGGSIALIHAARYPGSVASLILEAPHVFVEPLTTQSIAEFGKSVDGSGVLGRMAKYHRDPAAVFAQWHAIWSDPRFSQWSIEPELDAVKVPVLMIQGDEDEYGSFAQIDKIARHVPQAWQCRLEACGHSPHRDREKDVLAAIGDFLDTIDSS